MRPRLLINLALLLGTVLFFSAALEAVLRAIFAHSLDFGMEMWKYAVRLKRPVADPQLRFVHIPNRSAFLMGVNVSINSQGLRDHEYSPDKPPGIYRIVMLGDSTTLGWGVPLEQTVAKILERELNRTAIPGYLRIEAASALVCEDANQREELASAQHDLENFRRRGAAAGQRARRLRRRGRDDRGGVHHDLRVPRSRGDGGVPGQLRRDRAPGDAVARVHRLSGGVDLRRARGGHVQRDVRGRLISPRR